jgi:hypothetical protein
MVEEASIMLGAQVYEMQGRLTGMRVLEDGKVEASGMAKGMLRGEDVSSSFTYVTEFMPDGTSYGEIRAIYNTRSGESGRFKGNGRGVLNPDGSSSTKGAICFFNPPGKNEDLNRCAVAVEFDVDRDGNVSGKGWEWK